MKDDSQIPNPLTPSFEVPDLELNPVRNPAQQRAKPDRMSEGAGFGIFESDAGAQGLTLELDLDPVRPVRAVEYGSALDLDEPSSLDDAATNRLQGERELPRQTKRMDDERAQWPSGRALDPSRLEIKLADIRKLADYGPVPSDVRSTPRYAYRVYKRRRVLQQWLAEVSAERVRSDAEREAALAELATQLLPSLEGQAQFFQPLAALRTSEAALPTRTQPAIEVQRMLAELGRTILANRSVVEVSNEQFWRVSGACIQADTWCEMEEQLRRARGSYDATRLKQGVRLSCTVAALLLLLIAMNFAF